MTDIAITVTAVAPDGTVTSTQLAGELGARVLAWLGWRAPALPRLSTRERQVLEGLVDGLSYKQIAAERDIAIDTVRGHVRSLYRKLGVNCVQEAVALALRSGLVT